MNQKTVLVFDSVELVDISNGGHAAYVLDGTLYMEFCARWTDSPESLENDRSRIARHYFGRVVHRTDSPEWDSRGSIWFKE